MDNVFMIHLTDYIQHIDDKLLLFAMLKQLEDAIDKLPKCRETAEVRQRMAAFAPKLHELRESWNIPVRYLISGELDDLQDVMDAELMEPEDLGYYCTGDYEDESACALEKAEENLLALSQRVIEFSGELLTESKKLIDILDGQAQ